MGSGVSAIDTENSLILGCPYGSVGILWKKELMRSCVVRNYDTSRIIGIEFSHHTFHALFLCVYFLYECSDNYDEYLHCLSLIKQIIDEFPSPYVYILGDFNANFSQNSKFGEELMSWCNRYSLCITDKMLLPSDTFTHASMAPGSIS